MNDIELSLRQVKPVRVAVLARSALNAWALWVPLAAVGVAGAVLRLWRLGDPGFNSDEAVYAGQAASIAGDHDLSPYFPIFRAHPLLFQAMLSLGLRAGAGPELGRVLSAAFGLATIYLVYELGRLVFDRRTGLIAAAFLAVMPYHVVVARQMLLDIPMTFFTTLTLYLIARFAMSGRPVLLYGAGGAMGLSLLSKETSFLLLGAAYAFFALAPEVRLRGRDIALSLGVMLLVVSPYVLSVRFAGEQRTGQNFLVWQLFRRPNHDWTFYGDVLPLAIGPLVIVAAVAGLWLFRASRSWRETLLVAWIVTPIAFFELWPVKGFQYLLPIAPAFAVLAGRTVARLPQAIEAIRRRSWLVPAVASLVALTVAVPTWARIHPSASQSLLAGSGGVPGGREAGKWLDENVPVGSKVFAVGPSMANIVQFYGHRKAYGLSVSPNPLHRNPAYEPIRNADLWIRRNEVQYLIWDTFSADRSPFFAARLLRFVDRYNGRAVHTETVLVETAQGKQIHRPIIVIYEVHP